MGITFFLRCSTNYTAPAPNPSPDKWELLDMMQYVNGYVLKVRYYDCTNFEGVKVMVYRGQYQQRLLLDPHFQRDSESPIARFRPDYDGWQRANELARTL